MQIYVHGIFGKNNIKNSSPHNPPKVEGLSNEYYSKCQSGNGENLYSCGIISTSIIDSISSALDDSQGRDNIIIEVIDIIC